VIILSITTNKKRQNYSLSKGLNWLEVRESDLQTSQTREFVTIEISNPKDKEFGFKGAIELGGGNGFELFSWLEETLLEKYPDSEDSIGDFITLLLKERASQEVLTPPKKTNKNITGLGYGFAISNKWNINLLAKYYQQETI